LWIYLHRHIFLMFPFLTSWKSQTIALNLLLNYCIVQVGFSFRWALSCLPQDPLCVWWGFQDLSKRDTLRKSRCRCAEKMVKELHWYSLPLAPTGSGVSAGLGNQFGCRSLPGSTEGKHWTCYLTVENHPYFYSQIITSDDLILWCYLDDFLIANDGNSLWT
jgi:hypothetical protein